MIGQQVGGRYQILQVLGSGGFGMTYLAQDQHRPGQPSCVVKHLKPARKDPEFLHTARRLFTAEAEVLEKIGHHDRIPRLLAHFEQDQEFFLVEELIEGHDLSHELTHGQRHSEAQVMALLDQILEVLSYVHQHHVIHRDLKPSNLIRRRCDGQIVLIDFGAVKQIQDPTITTAIGSDLTIAIGSPGYLPDEQVAGKPRFASDVYAAGVIGIQALTGKMAQMIPSDPSTSELVWQDRVNISPDLAQVLEKMVRYDHRDRYPSAQSALLALRACTTAVSLSTPSASPASTLTFPVQSSSPAAAASPPCSTPPHPVASASPTAPLDPVPQPTPPLRSLTEAPAQPLASRSPFSSRPTEAPAQPPVLGSPFSSKLIWGLISALFVLTLGIGVMGGLLFSRRSTPPTTAYWLQPGVASTQIWQAQAPVTQMVLTPNGERLICSTANGLIKIWDVEQGKLPTVAAHSDRIESLVLLPGSSRGMTGGEDGQIILWDLETSQPLQVLSQAKPVRALTVSPQGDLAVSGGDGGGITYWSISGGEALRTTQVAPEDATIQSLQISPDGQLLAIADGTEQIQIWHLETDRQEITLTSEFPVEQVLFSPTDPILLARSADGVRVWDLTTGDLLRHLPQTFASVQSMALSADGQTLVTGSDFRGPSVRIWDLSTGELLHQLEGHTDGVSAIALSPDGQSLYSAGSDGEIKRWQVVEN